jgi:hypothetical protein
MYVPTHSVENCPKNGIFRDFLKSKKSRPHLNVERGWNGANEHFPQQNSNKDYRMYL